MPAQNQPATPRPPRRRPGRHRARGTTVALPDYDYVSQREFGLFLQSYNQLAARVEQMDMTGTRGVGVIQNQVTSLMQQVAGLETDVRTWQVAHQKDHKADAVQRTSARRWIVGTVIAAMACMATIGGMVAALLFSGGH